MAKATRWTGFLTVLLLVQAQSIAAGQVYDSNSIALAAGSTDVAVSPGPLSYPRLQATWMQRHSSPIAIDHLESCNYAARIKYPGATMPADGLPRPVGCWAHRWNSGLQTNY